MKLAFNQHFLLALSITLLLLTISTEIPASAGGGKPLNFIFTPDTPTDYVQKIYQQINLQIGPAFNADAHWNPAFTATHDGGSTQGDSIASMRYVTQRLKPGHPGIETLAARTQRNQARQCGNQFAIKGLSLAPARGWPALGGKNFIINLLTRNLYFLIRQLYH